ncbi:MAG: cytochrome c-type biogenesis protein CcmH [Pseudodonghicola sp.]|nr:cytochrome c-type biogenesis protein CcmH [Pseudodonghicola sp.]
MRRVAELFRGALLLLVLMLSGPVAAVQPDEILADPAMEARAREISKDLRCLVCRNENIDESNAELARDLRLLVRERLVAGDSNTETVAFIVDRYGEYVLLRPTTIGANWLLWAAGPLMLVMALVMAWFYLRGRSSAARPQESALTKDEQERLRHILEE